jgi:transcriptional regulator with XRE-family HTH domain
LNFVSLRQRLINVVNRLISNGLYTERGIARLTGISQPQVHNILKGARSLTPETADLLMGKMNILLLDLISREEAEERLVRVPRAFSFTAQIARKPAGIEQRFSAESKLFKAG